MSRRNLIRSSAGAALLVAAAAAWLAFAPAQLGGSATYAVVYGTSMLPHFHADDLVIVRKAAPIAPGRRPVREQRAPPARAAPDRRRPRRPVRDQGRQQRLPRPAARAAGRDPRPALAARSRRRALAALAARPAARRDPAALVALLLVGGGGTGVVRRRERTPRPSGRALPPAWLPPERSLLGELVAADAVALAAVGSRSSPSDAAETHRPGGEALRAEREARVRRLGAARGRIPGRAHRDGDAIFLKVADRVRLVLGYRFTSAAAHGVPAAASYRDDLGRATAGAAHSASGRRARSPATPRRSP